ncbi:hypothetical protein F5050DRAFT_1775276 [Lentinula boryana]|uniref:Uncharacterized protein n=1 Tax=Lentinula boryana TaxID=40481 RepID=A0ABQ8Q729_9AGAR|nr:hypothetical protein F5050DRAFT_1775276 [Lentinula boryana]
MGKLGKLAELRKPQGHTISFKDLQSLRYGLRGIYSIQESLFLQNMAPSNHPFFTLPTELHTHIFILACTPSTARGCNTASYYIAFFTGKALSLVNKYFNATSAPARHRAVVLYGWREIYGFHRILSEPSYGACACSCTRYLTLIADDLPQDPPLFSSIVEQVSAVTLMLDVIKSILYMVGHGLYELDIGLQAIECISNPLAYISLRGPLLFPHLTTLFFVCSPSNSPPSLLSMSTMTLSSMVPHLSCPRLKDLTFVCNDSPCKIGNIFEVHTLEFPDEALQSRDEALPESGLDSTVTDTIPDYTTNHFPALARLTILASTPAQALAALNAIETTWDVGCTFDIDGGRIMRQPRKTLASQTLSSGHRNGLWNLQTGTIVLKPKACWSEKWESLRDVAKRQRETNVEQYGRTDGISGDQDSEERKRSFCGDELNIFVLKPGEHCDYMRLSRRRRSVPMLSEGKVISTKISSLHRRFYTVTSEKKKTISEADCTRERSL